MGQPNIIVPLIAGLANVVEKYRQNHSGLSIGQVNDSDNSDDSSDENDDQIPDIQNSEISIPKSVIIQPRTPPKNSSKSSLFEENNQRPSHLVESLRDLCKLSGMSEEERKYYCHLCSYANINQDEFIQHVSSHYNFRYDFFWFQCPRHDIHLVCELGITYFEFSNFLFYEFSWCTNQKCTYSINTMI